jgi:PAS domain S-box-containing protein
MADTLLEIQLLPEVASDLEERARPRPASELAAEVLTRWLQHPPSHQDNQISSLILQSALDFAIFTLDEAGRVTSWSPGAQQLLGWTPAELMGKSADLIFTPEDRAASVPAKELCRARTDGKALDDRWHLRADGSRFWASGMMMRLHEADGAARGFVKIIRDRTLEREAERRFNIMTAALPGLVWIADPDGLVLETNERFRTFTARGRAELNGEGWLKLIHPEDLQAVREGWSEAVRSGSPFRSRQRIRSENGNYRCFDCHAVPERDEEGKIVHWLASCLDVDDEHRARAALERLNLALEHQATQSTADLAAAIEELQREITTRRKA